jgi:AcrR family transcriptional regulator
VGNPVKHTEQAMLDTARGLLLEGGPAAASARGVGLAMGAPSGSIYHRFPRRDDLMAATWLRAQDRFLEAYLERLAGNDLAAGVAAAVLVLSWCGANTADAALLLRYSLRELLRDDISPALAERAQANQARLGDGLRSYVDAVQVPAADVTLAVIDLPYAMARRIHREGRRFDAAEESALQRAASLLLGAL